MNIRCPICYGPTDTGLRCTDANCDGSKRQEFYVSAGTTMDEDLMDAALVEARRNEPSESVEIVLKRLGIMESP